ncbi:nitroreductase [Propionivibrio dicarboxylicus]|uniref:Nitroreductase n=1 Tax=Propionivibrio dicarboxylicus TaxID=83767 RepID=A0A1G8FRB9_9RHOO|nr:nitroreductase [Propionivibrio dicarboxylicus]SDH84651.1 Nitroreductase [Propionivibrio dicarboxylicus]
MTTDNIQAVDAAIRSRHSIRRFLPTPVPREALRELLELASCAPSGTNIQPWRVYALAGKEKEALSTAIMERFTRGETDGGRELDYYPKEWVEPWLSRRRKCGLGLYSLLGITKGDTDRMKVQTGRNFQFFDAPVGMIFTLDNRLGKGMLVDCGMFMGNLMVAARARGIDTCVQAFFADYHKTIRATLNIPDNEIVYCGMALGYADPNAPENTLITEREPVEGFTDFRGF